MDERVKKKKNVREPPSVPFLWEAKPGIPKKDWKPMVYSSVSELPKTSLNKQIASVPFVWEEKPGKPLPSFQHVSLDSPPSKLDAILIHVASSSGYTASINYGYDHHKNKQNSSAHNVHQQGSCSSHDDDESESITSLELEAFGFDTDESCKPVHSLLANCVVSSSKNIPLQKNSLSKHNCDKMYTPSSPTSSEEESSISSYATGRSSPTGSAFLECLFPLYSPKSGFLEKDDDEKSEKVLSSTPLKLKAKDHSHEDQKCDMLRRPPTLGELIMMSRRRSNRRKAAQMNIWDPPKKNLTRKQAFGCFSFITSSNRIEGLLKKKYYPPRLKLV